MKFLVSSQISNRSGKEHIFIRLGKMLFIIFNWFTAQAVVANMNIDIPCTYHSFEILFG